MSKASHRQFVIHLVFGIGLFVFARLAQSGAVDIPMQQWGMPDRMVYIGITLLALLGGIYCVCRAIWFLRGGGNQGA